MEGGGGGQTVERCFDWGWEGGLPAVGKGGCGRGQILAKQKISHS